MIRSFFKNAFDSLSSFLRLSLVFFFEIFSASVPPIALVFLCLHLNSRFLDLFFSATVGASNSIRFLRKTLSNLSLIRSSWPWTFNCRREGANSSSSWKSVFLCLYLKRPTTAGLETSPIFSCFSFSSFSALILAASHLACFLVSSTSWRIKVSMIPTWWETNLSCFASFCYSYLSKCSFYKPHLKLKWNLPCAWDLSWSFS